MSLKWLLVAGMVTTAASAAGPHTIRKRQARGNVLLAPIVTVRENSMTVEQRQEYRESALVFTNQYRGRHEVPPLIRDDYLDSQAQIWAENILSSKTWFWMGSSYGENMAIFSVCPSNADAWFQEKSPTSWARVVIDYWYAGATCFDYSTGITVPDCTYYPHYFAQMLGKNVKRVGFGVARLDDRLWATALYDPEITEPWTEQLLLPGGIEPEIAPVPAPGSSGAAGASGPVIESGSQAEPRAGSLPLPEGPASWLDMARLLTLLKHNELRGKHYNTPLMVLDQFLTTTAQFYAETLASTVRFEHSNTPGLGENLYTVWRSNGFDEEMLSNQGVEASIGWYQEIEYYDWNTHDILSRLKGDPQKQIGHFTQMVWDTSNKLGVGVSLSPDKKNVYVVCNYSPPGNYRGENMMHVNPLK